MACRLFVESSDLVRETGIDLVDGSDFDAEGEVSTETVSVTFIEIVWEMLIDSEWVK